MDKAQLTGGKVFAVRSRVSSHVHQLWSDAIDQRLFLVTLGHSQRTLENVVYKHVRILIQYQIERH